MRLSELVDQALAGRAGPESTQGRAELRQRLDILEAQVWAMKSSAGNLTVVGANADLLDGQHGAYYLAWANLTGEPTTLGGYGITDVLRTGAGVLTLAAATDLTLTVAGASTINGSLVGSMTGGGTIATGGFTGTIPKDGTLPVGTGALNQATYWADTNTLAGLAHPATAASALTQGTTGAPVWMAYSSAPGAAAALLASTVDGYLGLVRLGLGGVTAPGYPLHVRGLVNHESIDNVLVRAEYNTFITTITGVVHDINIHPADATSTALMRYFRSTNTSAAVALQVMVGNNTNTIQHYFRGNGNSYVVLQSGNFGIGIAAGAAKTHVLATTEQLRLGYDATKYASWTVGATGTLTLATVGEIVLTPAASVTLSDGKNWIFGTTTGSMHGTAANQKQSFWGATPIVQPVLAAYTSDGEGAAYTGIDNAQAGGVYAQVSDLNLLRTAYETLRAAYDDLRTKIKTTGILA